MFVYLDAIHVCLYNWMTSIYCFPYEMDVFTTSDSSSSWKRVVRKFISHGMEQPNKVYFLAFFLFKARHHPKYIA